MMTELKPCPFCGGEPTVRRTVREYPSDGESPAGEYDEWFNIDCNNCGVTTGDEYRSYAVQTWNRRSQ